MFLYNRFSKEELEKKLNTETFQRITLSFYRYVRISDAQSIHNLLFEKLNSLGCLGRIYVANEGINAQMNIPEPSFNSFKDFLESIEEFKNMPFKYAVENDTKSFLKLVIKVKEKIVADGLADESYDVTNVGNHLSALEFHELLDKPDTILVDMRNFYESEIGHFRGAILPQTDTFREEIQLVAEELADKKDKKFLLYCTGGIRCEKASAYLKHRGFKDVNQLHGGIIEYARQIKEHSVVSKFIGKNFVFDERLAEKISNDVISKCHQCGKPCDKHTNCANNGCHILFLQCKECNEKFSGCCSENCASVLNLPIGDILNIRKEAPKGKRWFRLDSSKSHTLMQSPY